MRILVVEDDKHMAQQLRRALTEEGYAVDTAISGEESEEYLDSVPYDLIILDIMLGGKDGIAVCQDIRKEKIKTPVLMLTAPHSMDDKVKGLDNGADDCLAKPIAFEELYARVRALLRREDGLLPQLLQAGDLVLDTGSRWVTRGERIIPLTAKEYAILEYLMRHPDKLVTRIILEQHVWDLSLDSSSNLVDVYISRLRRKIDGDDPVSLIQTTRGAGYRISFAGTRAKPSRANEPQKLAI